MMRFNSRTLVVLIILGFSSLCFGDDTDMPCPFTRELSYQNPELQGDDVVILQSLLPRSPFVTVHLAASGSFDQNTEQAVLQFQKGNKLSNASGIFEAETATTLLNLHESDTYKDNGKIPAGYKYKVYVPVHRNRSIETTGYLYNSNMTLLLTFPIRSHGQNLPSGAAMNQFCGDGNTPTGLMSFDLNSPEDDPTDYGPYPVNRAVQGIEGNAAIVISDIRDGILMHTGEWPNWNPSEPMPNSHGCLHSHPNSIKAVWQILVKQLQVIVRPNTFGKLPYPYVPQGILSIEQID